MIEAEKIYKTFGRQRALRNLSFVIEKGKHVSLLGGNGAGKTTLISILSTLVKPSRGTARINGWDLIKQEDRIRTQVGVVGHQPFLYPQLNALENLRFYGRLFGTPELENRIQELLNRVHLAHRRFDLVKTLSRGMVQRLSLARALLHNPMILLLDEPLTGLDVTSRTWFNRLLESLKQNQVTILSATHNIDLAMSCSDRILLLKNGQLQLDQQVSLLQKQEIIDLLQKNVSLQR